MDHDRRGQSIRDMLIRAILDRADADAEGLGRLLFTATDSMTDRRRVRSSALSRTVPESSIGNQVPFAVVERERRDSRLIVNQITGSRR